MEIIIGTIVLVFAFTWGWYKLFGNAIKNT